MQILTKLFICSTALLMGCSEWMDHPTENVAKDVPALTIFDESPSAITKCTHNVENGALVLIVQSERPLNAFKENFVANGWNVQSASETTCTLTKTHANKREKIVIEQKESSVYHVKYTP